MTRIVGIDKIIKEQQNEKFEKLKNFRTLSKKCD